jgi:hypothetical protein
MSTTLYLLGLALAVLLGVALHAWWVARRTAPRQPEPMPEALASPAEVTAATGPIEPSLEGRTDGVLPSLEPQEPVLGDLNDALSPRERPEGAALVAPVAPRRVASKPSTRLDPLIDVIVSVQPEQAISGDAALAHWPSSRRAGTKPMLVEGLNLETLAWEQPERGQSYVEFQAGVQMVNRSGPLNDIQYSEFVQKIQTFADAIGAAADFPDMLEVVAHAREIDAFASPLDAQLMVRLKARSTPWSLGFVQQCAARHGFVKGALPGRMEWPGEEPGAPPVLVLAVDSQMALTAEDGQDVVLREVTLALDVPQTPEELDPFPNWHRLASLLSKDMEAVVVDDMDRPVTLHAFDVIGKDLKGLYRSLAERDMPAGSPVARRVFS